MTWFGNARRRGRAGLPAIACALATVLLSGCGSVLSLLPPANEPVAGETAELRDQQFPRASLMEMPREIAAAFPDGHGPGAARFLTRTLETAPDGDRRRWQSDDRTVVFVVQPNSTTVTAGSICRSAILTVETPQDDRSFDLRTCRQKNGMWTR